MFKKLLYMLLFLMAYGLEIKQLDCEHPKLAFVDPEFFTNISMKSTRRSRSDSTHYFNFNVTIMKPLDKDITLTILLQQQNNILPTANLLELHYRLCEIINDNNIIVKQFKEAFYRMPKDIRPMPHFKCPFNPGSYFYTNMGMPAFILPNNFPALDGRITSALLYKNRVVIKVYGIFHVK